MEHQHGSASPRTDAAPAAVAAGVTLVAPDRAERLAGRLLTLTVVLAIVLPGLLGAAAPHAAVEFSFSTRDVALAQILGTTAALAGLFAAARAVDLWGVRPVLVTAFSTLLVSGLAVVAAFGGWMFLGAAVLEQGAVAAVLAACLAYVPLRHLPGHITRAIGTALAALGLASFAEINLVTHLEHLVGWRGLLALTPLAALAMPVLVHRFVSLPAPASESGSRLGGFVGTAAVAALLLIALGLQLAPWWGWSAPAPPILIAIGAATGVAALLAARRSGRRLVPAEVPRPTIVATVTAGFAFGVTQVALSVATPVIALDRGAAAWQAALILSASGLGIAGGALLARRRRYSRQAGSSLGLLAAVVGLSLLYVLPHGATAATWAGCALLALTGFGLIVAQVPHVAGYLTVLPRRNRAIAASLYPAAILFGAMAAQCLPYASLHPYASQSVGGSLGGAQLLLRIAVLVVAVAAAVLGRPAVAFAVVMAGSAQYVLLQTLTRQERDQPAAVTAAMAVGTLAGLLTWTRREQSERLARTQAAAETLQDAVLHPVPDLLGGLRMAGLYRPATVDTGIGGDFFEAVETPFGVRVLVGDVRGKGVQAVRTVTDLLGAFRSQAHETPELGELVARLDRQVTRAAITRADEELFATAVVLQYSGRSAQIDVVNCGHPSPLYVTAAAPGLVRELDAPTGLPLGFGALHGDGKAPHAARVALDPAATLVLYTDGLSEARNASGEFYPLIGRIAAAPSAPAKLVAFLAADILDWTHNRSDDVAVVAVAADVSGG